MDEVIALEKDFYYGSKYPSDADWMCKALQLLAPEWEFCRRHVGSSLDGPWGVWCERPALSCFVAIRWSHRQISPLFIEGLNNMRKRGENGCLPVCEASPDT
jgi:hypothetical protein